MSDLPKVVYFGSDSICLPGLKYLFECAKNYCVIAAVITQPDRRQGRGKKLQHNAVAAYARAQKIPLHQPEKPSVSLVQLFRKESIKLAFVMAYGHYLPKAVREAPECGILNLHGSILPNYRGASPVETALAMGDAETGLCLMKVVEEMDAGPVADCESINIENEDTSITLRDKVGKAAVPLLRRNLQASLRGDLEFMPQDSSRATYSRKITKEDGALDFRLSASVIISRLRAFYPWPGGYFNHANIRIKVGRCSVLSSESTVLPGTIIRVGQSLDISTSCGIICVHELQRPGRRLLPVPDFIRGYPISLGDVLPSVSSNPLLK